MSKLTEDIKAGLKGVRGMGDVLRGEMMDAADKTFESRRNQPAHEADLRSQTKNEMIKEKGRQDVQGMDDMFARREREKQGAYRPGEPGLRGENVHPHPEVPGQTHPVTENQPFGGHESHLGGAPTHTHAPPTQTGHHESYTNTVNNSTHTQSQYESGQHNTNYPAQTGHHEPLTSSLNAPDHTQPSIGSEQHTTGYPAQPSYDAPSHNTLGGVQAHHQPQTNESYNPSSYPPQNAHHNPIDSTGQNHHTSQGHHIGQGQHMTGSEGINRPLEGNYPGNESMGGYR